MLENLKRWFSSSSNAQGAADFSAVKAWAEQRQYGYRAVRNGDGCAVDGKADALAWRLECGPSQRPYIEGHEVRLRAEIRVDAELQVLVVNRTLQERLEAAVFEQYVEGVQTRIDTETPPEMRWLVMFPKLGASELGPLRERYGAVASVKPWLMSWLEGDLAAALSSRAGAADEPLVLTIARGRLTLRASGDELTPVRLDSWVRLFVTALREAQRVIARPPPDAGSATPSSLFPNSASPQDDSGRG